VSAERSAEEIATKLVVRFVFAILAAIVLVPMFTFSGVGLPEVLLGWLALELARTDDGKPPWVRHPRDPWTRRAAR
jgi:hypothetical protein